MLDKQEARIRKYEVELEQQKEECKYLRTQHECVNRINLIRGDIEAVGNETHNDITGLRNHVNTLVINMEVMAQDVLEQLGAQQQLLAALVNQNNELIPQVPRNQVDDAEEVQEEDPEEEQEEDPEEEIVD